MSKRKKYTLMDGTFGGDWGTDKNLDSAREYISANTTNPFWNSLTPAQQTAFLKQYASETSNFGTTLGNILLPLGMYKGSVEDIDVDSIISDLDSLTDIEEFTLNEPIMSDYVWDSDRLYSAIDDEISGRYALARDRISDEMRTMRQDYADQLRTSADMYNRQASGLLSNQYLANAQTYDAMQSDMSKARRNALEAGASAGIRLAGNVNALLSAQNKQSQTSMDTSNALAEMLLQQRNAAAGIRSDYRGYMSEANQRKTNLDMQQANERENLYNQRHSAQMNDYNSAYNSYNSKVTNWENQFDDTNKFSSSYKNYLKNKEA